MRVFIVPGPEFKRVEAALGAQAASLPRRLREALRDRAEELAEQARSRVRKLPIRGSSGKHTGLRQRVAAGTRVVGTPVGARVITSMPESDEAIIPRGLDRHSGWSHPVYGNRNVWVRQVPYKAGWFVDTFSDGRDDIQDDLEDILEDAADNIAARGNSRGIPGV